MKKGVVRLLFPLSARLPDGELTPLHPIVWNVRDEPYPDLLLLSGVRVGAEMKRLEITWNTVLFAFVFYVDVVVDFQLLRCRIGVTFMVNPSTLYSPSPDIGYPPIPNS